MKKVFTPKYLPWLPIGAGILGLALRLWLYSLRDASKLLPEDHIAAVLLFLLTGLTLAALFLCVRSIPQQGSFSQRFRPSLWGSIGNLAAAGGLLLWCIIEFISAEDIFSRICLPFGAVSAVCLALAGIRRFRGSVPSFAGYCLVTVYMMVHAISQCRGWGSEPQLMHYCFQLLASIFVMITAFQRAALTLDRGDYRWFTFVSQAAVFFCCLSLNTENALFYLCVGIWSAADLCNFQEE